MKTQPAKLLGHFDAMKIGFSDTRIAIAAAKFPREFALRGHAGKFRISDRDSYIADGDVVILYTETLRGDRWQAFAKTTEGELTVEASFA